MITYDFITDFLREVSPKNEGILLELETYAQENHVPIIQPEVGRLLIVLCQMIRPIRVLEIGTAIGYSALLMAQSLPNDGRIDTIERYEKMIELARGNIEKAGESKRINIIVGEALDILTNLDNSYDLIFLDGAKGQYIEFLPHCMRLLRDGGLLVTDNVLYKGMVANRELLERRKKTIVQRLKKYLVEISQHPLLETSILPVGDGVAVSFKKRSFA